MNRKKYVILYSAFLFFSLSAFLHCVQNEEANLEKTANCRIRADIETEPVSAKQNDDAADDPAIWINFDDPNKSLIVGTNKKAGLNLYDLNGNEVFFIDEGRVNNVDVRYGFDLNGTIVDIIGSSNRSNNSLALHILDGEKQELIPVHARTIKSQVDEVYGFCFYHSHISGNYYAFINGKDGQIEQWQLFATPGNKIDAELIRTLRVDSQPEGMVADDEMGILYTGEEGRGVWRFKAEPDRGDKKTFIQKTGKENPAMEFDVEGLAILYLPEGKGYLIVSSQGNNSYAVFNRNGRNEYLKSFNIIEGENIDGAEETDGLEVSNYGFSERFPAGILVVQDGFNFDGDSLSSQNFKIVDLRKVVKVIDPDMIIDPGYNPYKK